MFFLIGERERERKRTTEFESESELESLELDREPLKDMRYLQHSYCEEYQLHVVLEFDIQSKLLQEGTAPLILLLLIRLLTFTQPMSKTRIDHVYTGTPNF
ncbi:hypothetical protein ABEB36_009597 [Hypothenemus hampei]|uniref:Uncharacterized protein n=1 Tax=Hypothenemus hampei TaxID=57062 RepID=A0ABD1EGU3_HYPHA